jgi:hypothetical protein
VPKHLPEFD